MYTVFLFSIYIYYFSIYTYYYYYLCVWITKHTWFLNLFFIKLSYIPWDEFCWERLLEMMQFVLWYLSRTHKIIRVMILFYNLVLWPFVFKRILKCSFLKMVWNIISEIIWGNLWNQNTYCHWPIIMFQHYTLNYLLPVFLNEDSFLHISWDIYSLWRILSHCIVDLIFLTLFPTSFLLSYLNIDCQLLFNNC